MKLLDPVRNVLKQKGHDVWSVSAKIPVYNAIQMMADKHVGALLVLADHKLVGIISERDYARKVILRGKSSKLMEVQEIMTTPVTIVAPENTVQDCMKIMTEKRIRHLPIIENEKLLGVVSIGDLVKWIISAQAETIQHLENYISSAYPG